MLRACFLHLYFCQSLPMLQRGLFEIADLLVTTCVHLMICHPPFDVCYGIWCILPGVANAALDFFCNPGPCALTGFLRSGKVREFLRSQGKSGKTERVREKSGNFKIPLTKTNYLCIIFTIFVGFAPRLPQGLRPSKRCRLVYIAIFYNEQSLVLHLCT